MRGDSDTVNLSHAAKALGVHRNTVGNWVKAGYECEYGHLTTLGHLKKWLREIYAPQVRARKRARGAAEAEVEARLELIRSRGKRKKG
jgi:hypothetical protein